MFELLFHYPRHVFSKGELVLLGSWPKWMLAALIVAGAAALALLIRSRLPEAAESVRGWRASLLWLLQSLLLAILLVLLWQPALLVSTLKPQQNVIAVVVDDSESMSIAEGGATRLDTVRRALSSGVLEELGRRFQVRLYKMSDHVERVKNMDALAGRATSSRIGDSLEQLSAETSGLPLGGVVLVTDGADNAGGIDAKTLAGLRGRRVPVHTVGVGRETAARDLELADALTPVRALADSRVAAQVSFVQRGYAGRKATLTVKDGGKVLASRPVTLKPDGNLQTETILFSAGSPGARAFQFSLSGLDQEENTKNNATSRLITVDNSKPRILYLEGEPRWEFKFIRRAMEDDKSVRLTTMLRTTQNKVYRQGIENPQELEQGFPAKVEELFQFHGLVIGSVEVGYFTAAQQELLKQFVDRRGGGLLMLSGRAGLADGGYGRTSLAELLPVVLPDRKNTFRREPATAELAPAGVENLITRLAEDSARNQERWQKMPYLVDHQDAGTPKPGAAVLLTMSGGGRTQLPMLVTQNYGRGRVAVLAGGTWRWQMSQPLEDTTHEQFWQQLLRWLVAETPGRVVSSTPRPMLFDESRVRLTAEVRDRTYLPAADAHVVARVLGPSGSGGEVEMTPDPVNPGFYHAEFNADRPGSFAAEIIAKRGEEEVGRDVLTFQRQDGVAENFRTAQNRPLLESLASQTGGRYWTAGELGKLPAEIALSEAGLTIRETRELWNMPAVFLLLFGLRASEWLLRRKWGVV